MYTVYTIHITHSSIYIFLFKSFVHNNFSRIIPSPIFSIVRILCSWLSVFSCKFFASYTQEKRWYSYWRTSITYVMCAKHTSWRDFFQMIGPNAISYYYIHAGNVAVNLHKFSIFFCFAKLSGIYSNKKGGCYSQ